VPRPVTDPALPEGLSILVPIYNERDRVEQALREILAVELACPYEVVIVDDGSTDGTTDLLRRVDWPDNVRLHFHSKNLGKGAAVQTALADARLRFSAIFDADLEYDPQDLEAVTEPLLRDDKIRAVYGIRTFDAYHSHSFLFVMGNKGVTLATNVLFNVYIHDLMTCHKALDTELFRSLPLRARGFTIEPEITARLLQRGERLYEVPVHYNARSSSEGKKLTAVDGVRVLMTLLRCRLTSA
jgi:glycosyltransferase involved in cell wall biosynthesis